MMKRDCVPQSMRYSRDTKISWTMETLGSLNNLTVREMSREPVGPNEVRVEVQVIGLNFADVFSCLGLYSATPPPPFVPGLEFSGIIVEIGAGVELVIGERVFGFSRFGSFTSHVVTRKEFVRPMPSEWSFEEGASFLVQSLTAYHAVVELGQISRESIVLVQSAAGGVGLYALALSQAVGAIPICTVGNNAKKQFLHETKHIPLEHIIVRPANGDEFGSLIQAAFQHANSTRTIDEKGDGYDVVLEAICGDCFKPCYDNLARGGKMVVFGSASYMPSGNSPNWFSLAGKYLSRPSVDPANLVTDNKSILGFNLIWMTDRVKLMTREIQNMMRLLSDEHGNLNFRPHVGRTFEMNEMLDALKFLQSGQSIGKVVVRIDHGRFNRDA